MINENQILRIENGLLTTCVEIRMSLEDFLKVAEDMRWLVQKFSAFEEIKVYANDGLGLMAFWNYIPNEQSTAFFWSRKYE